MSSAMMASRTAGICSVSGRCSTATEAGAARSRAMAPRRAAMMGAGVKGQVRRKAASHSMGMSVRATLLEPEKTVATTTFQRDPLDVVASNGREVEAFALEACAKRQESGLLVPKCNVPADLLDAAYERCNLVTGEYAKTFYLGTKLMTPEKQRAIWAIYVWCRRTDELVDGPNASHITPEALDRWEERLENIFAGRPTDVIDAALCDTLSKFPVDIQPFRDMVDGMRMDLVKPRYETFDELYEYCYRVAGTVGLMSMPIMGTDDNFKGDLRKVYKAALALGLANQLTNILRDVGEDIAERNRIYVPLEDLDRFGITEQEVLKGMYSKTTGKVDDRWRAFMQFQIARAREVFKEAEDGVNCLHEDARWPVWSALDVYRGILDAIEANDYDNFSKRAYVPKMKKFAMLPLAYGKSREPTLY